MGLYKDAYDEMVDWKHKYEQTLSDLEDAYELIGQLQEKIRRLEE